MKVKRRIKKKMKKVNIEATGMQIKALCLQKGLKQKDLSEKLGVKTTSPYLWFNGEVMPKLDTLVNLCDLLECKLEDILVVEETADLGDIEDGQ